MACPTRIIEATVVGGFLVGEAEIATGPPGSNLRVPVRFIQRKNGLIIPPPAWFTSDVMTFTQYDRIDENDGLQKRFLKVSFSIPYSETGAEPTQPDPSAIYSGYFLCEQRNAAGTILAQTTVNFCLAMPSAFVAGTTFLLGQTTDSPRRIVYSPILKEESSGEYRVAFSLIDGITLNDTAGGTQNIWYDNNSQLVIISDKDPNDTSKLRIRTFSLDNPLGSIQTIVDYTDGWSIGASALHATLVIGEYIHYFAAEYRKIKVDGTNPEFVYNMNNTLRTADTGVGTEVVGQSSGFAAVRAVDLADNTLKHSTGLAVAGAVRKDVSTGLFYSYNNPGGGAKIVCKEIDPDDFAIGSFGDPLYNIQYPVGYMVEEDSFLFVSVSGSVQLLRAVNKAGTEGITLSLDLEAQTTDEIGASLLSTSLYAFQL